MGLSLEIVKEYFKSGIEFKPTLDGLGFVSEDLTVLVTDDPVKVYGSEPVPYWYAFCLICSKLDNIYVLLPFERGIGGGLSYDTLKTIVDVNEALSRKGYIVAAVFDSDIGFTVINPDLFKKLNFARLRRASLSGYVVKTRNGTPIFLLWVDGFYIAFAPYCDEDIQRQVAKQLGYETQ